MEVSLHRTRALLGEKVIRLRHLEHSLQCVYEKEKPLDLQSEDNKLNRKEDATLSDVSSHSSSGFSSTDMNTDTLQGQRKDLLQESSEIMQSLENLNAEIREIWDILSKQQIQGKVHHLNCIYKTSNIDNWKNTFSRLTSTSTTNLRTRDQMDNVRSSWFSNHNGSLITRSTRNIPSHNRTQYKPISHICIISSQHSCISSTTCGPLY